MVENVSGSRSRDAEFQASNCLGFVGVPTKTGSTDEGRWRLSSTRWSLTSTGGESGVVEIGSRQERYESIRTLSQTSWAAICSGGVSNLRDSRRVLGHM